MKKIIIIGILLINVQLFAQNTPVNGEIIYEQIISNSDGIVSKEYVLFFNQKNSYYEEVINKQFEKTQEKKEDGTIVLSLRDNQHPQFYYNSLRDGFYFSEVVYNQHLFTKDNFKLNWNLSTETKQIGGYECQKAITKFRGRTYIAWFTNSIPLIFGPWKLNGLSGLILEAYDTTGYFQVRAKKIIIGYNAQKNQFSLKKDKAMSMDELRTKTKELETAFLSRLNSKLPKGMKPFKIDKNCEDCPKGLEIFDEEN